MAATTVPKAGMAGVGQTAFDVLLGWRYWHMRADLSLAAYRLRFGHTGNLAWVGVVGCRALYVDYVQCSGATLFETNLLQHGPLIGLSARF